MIDEHDLIARLGSLGEVLDLPATRTSRVVDVVLARLDEFARPVARAASVRDRRGLAFAAAVAVVVAGSVLAVPDARHAVARWLGLDAVSVKVDPDLSSTAHDGTFTTPGPGESRVVTVDGRQILVSAIAGALDEALIAKTVGSSEQVLGVDVAGWPGLWIEGDPHEVMYRDLDGSVLVERVAADTLLWQEADVLLRVEGFTELDAALDYAAEIAAAVTP